MYTRVNPSFTTLKWGVKGYSLHGHVIMMVKIFSTAILPLPLIQEEQLSANGVFR